MPATPFRSRCDAACPSYQQNPDSSFSTRARSTVNQIFWLQSLKLSSAVYEGRDVFRTVQLQSWQIHSVRWVQTHRLLPAPNPRGVPLWSKSCARQSATETPQDGPLCRITDWRTIVSTDHGWSALCQTSNNNPASTRT